MNMKTTFKSMMVIGMMFLGTMTTFGKTNTNVHNNSSRFGVHTTAVKKECYLRHVHDRKCGGMVSTATPMMDKKMESHIIKGNHNFDRHGVCKKCKYTRTEIRRMEESMKSSHNHGMTCPVPHRGH